MTILVISPATSGDTPRLLEAEDAPSRGGSDRAHDSDSGAERRLDTRRPPLPGNEHSMPDLWAIVNRCRLNGGSFRGLSASVEHDRALGR